VQPSTDMVHISPESDDDQWYRRSFLSNGRSHTVLSQLGDDQEREACHIYGSLHMVCISAPRDWHRTNV
jgi:hypothetical protein